jgi:hypothetical protein
VELKNSLEAGFGVPLAVSVVYDHPTIDQLAGHLCEWLERS